MSRRSVGSGEGGVGITRCAAVLLLCLAAPSGAQQAPQGRMYADDEVAAGDPETFFEAMAQVPEGIHPFAGLNALVTKGRGGDPETRQAIIERAIGILEDPALAPFQRWQCCYVLSGIGDEQAVPVLANALRGDAPEVVRSVAACALGQFGTPEAEAALRGAGQREASQEVRDTIAKALRGEFRRGDQGEQAEPVAVADVLSGKLVTVTRVEDLIAIENSGEDLEEVRFERYFPVVDEEQAVLARWAEALDQDGLLIPMALTGVAADEEGNLIHTWSLAHLAAQGRLSVTITSVVARHERPAPEGRFPIPAAEAYPAAVQPFLAATPMVARDDPSVAAQSGELLAQTDDAYELARALADAMRARFYEQQPNADPTLPTAASILKYGGSCCGSAVAAAAVLRAGGIPAQITYAPAGYIHGIVRFYLQGYGWVRMDATCGTAKVPLMQEADDLGLARLFDMPIGMEQIPYAYAWPYFHNDATGKYAFRVEGQARPEVRFADTDNWSRNHLLGGVPWDGSAEDWAALAEASREAVASTQLGEFAEVTAHLPAAGAYLQAARRGAG